MERKCINEDKFCEMQILVCVWSTSGQFHDEWKMKKIWEKDEGKIYKEKMKKKDEENTLNNDEFKKNK